MGLSPWRLPITNNLTLGNEAEPALQIIESRRVDESPDCSFETGLWDLDPSTLWKGSSGKTRPWGQKCLERSFCTKTTRAARIKDACLDAGQTFQDDMTAFRQRRAAGSPGGALNIAPDRLTALRVAPVKCIDNSDVFNVKLARRWSSPYNRL